MATTPPVLPQVPPDISDYVLTRLAALEAGEKGKQKLGDDFVNGLSQKISAQTNAADPAVKIAIADYLCTLKTTVFETKTRQKLTDFVKSLISVAPNPAALLPLDQLVKGTVGVSLAKDLETTTGDAEMEALQVKRINATIATAVHNVLYSSQSSGKFLSPTLKTSFRKAPVTPEELAPTVRYLFSFEHQIAEKSAHPEADIAAFRKAMQPLLDRFATTQTFASAQHTQTLLALGETFGEHEDAVQVDLKQGGLWVKNPVEECLYKPVREDLFVRVDPRGATLVTREDVDRAVSVAAKLMGKDVSFLRTVAAARKVSTAYADFRKAERAEPPAAEKKSSYAKFSWAPSDNDDEATINRKLADQARADQALTEAVHRLETVAAKDDAPEKIAMQPFFTQPVEDIKTAGNTEMYQALIDRINNAERSIEAAFYGIDLVPELIDALVAAKNRTYVDDTGKERPLEIRIVVDQNADGSFEYAQTEQLIALLNDESGSVVRVEANDQRSIMHHKFFVIDHQDIWTGSTNLNDTAIGKGYNNEISVCIRSEYLAAVFGVEQAQMFAGKFHKAKEALTPTQIPPAADGTEISVFFSPEHDALKEGIIPAINSAQKRIDLSLFHMSDETVVGALVAARARGVSVRLIVDAEGGANAYTRRNIEILRAAGAQVKVENWGGKQHMKGGTIDGRISIVGSLNWTSGGVAKNDENCLVIQNQKGDHLAQAIQTDFDAKYEKLPALTAYGYPRAEGLWSVGTLFDDKDNLHTGLVWDPIITRSAYFSTLAKLNEAARTMTADPAISPGEVEHAVTESLTVVLGELVKASQVYVKKEGVTPAHLALLKALEQDVQKRIELQDLSAWPRPMTLVPNHGTGLWATVPALMKESETASAANELLSPSTLDQQIDEVVLKIEQEAVAYDHPPEATAAIEGLRAVQKGIQALDTDDKNAAPAGPDLSTYGTVGAPLVTWSLYHATLDWLDRATHATYGEKGDLAEMATARKEALQALDADLEPIGNAYQQREDLPIAAAALWKRIRRDIQGRIQLEEINVQLSAALAAYMADSTPALWNEVRSLNNARLRLNQSLLKRPSLHNLIQEKAWKEQQRLMTPA